MKKKKDVSIPETVTKAQAKKLFAVLKRFSTNKQVSKMKASDLRDLQLAVTYVVEFVKDCVAKKAKPE